MNAAIVLAVLYMVLITIAFATQLHATLKYRKAIKEMETRWDNLPIRGRKGGSNGKRKRA